MRTQRAKLAEQLRSSLWVVPAASTLVAALAAVILVDLDRRTGPQGLAIPWVFHGGAESARAVLSTIAGSMITVAGTVYSITIVVLTLASVQFAPRVLRNFMRDRGNQITLGFFVATFTYCLLVLRSVRDTQEGEFVPSIAVTGGVVLALTSLGMLIYFIDHIFRSLQVSNIIRNVAAETERHIDQLYPEEWQSPGDTSIAQPSLSGNWAPVPSRDPGYLQFIDRDAIVDIAVREGLVFRQDRAVGAFFTPGAALVYASPAENLTEEVCEQVNAAFAFGTNPTLQQDVAFGIRQIVDIALKAISPAVNDPTTAVNCIDHLGVILATLATRVMPELDCRDDKGQIRLYVEERTFHDLVRLAFDQIRHFGASDPIIVLRMLGALVLVSAVAKNPAYQASLLEYVERIGAAAERRIDDPYECDVIRDRVQEAREALRPVGRF